MPYIKDENNRREELRDGAVALNAGELNYKIFTYIKDCLAKNLSPRISTIKYFVDIFLGKNPNYQRYNDMTGCLIRCRKEVQRRFGLEAKGLKKVMESYDQEIADYEEEKIIENGDV
jgi:hypothetical protein